MGVAAGVRIREAKKDELSRIRELTIQELPDELYDFEKGGEEAASAAFSERIDELFGHGGNEFYVAEVDGEPGMAGYVWLGVSHRPFSGMKVGWIYDIQVVPAHRGKGIGRALMEHALKASRERGFALTGLMVKADNKPAYALYESLGFRPDFMMMNRREPGAGPASNS